MIRKEPCRRPIPPGYPGIPGIRRSPPSRPPRQGHFTPVKTMAKCPRLPSKTHETRLTPTETHPWAIDAAQPGRATARMAHRCRSRRNDGPSLRLPPPAGQHPWPIVAVRRADMPALAVAPGRSGRPVPVICRFCGFVLDCPSATGRDFTLNTKPVLSLPVVTITKCEPEPHQWAIVEVRRTRLTTSKAQRCCSRSIDGPWVRLFLTELGRSARS